MGLDMYARTRAIAPETPVDFIQADEDTVDPELFYWRKHSNLHGWMERLYYAKGGTVDVFNAAPVVLTSEDLDALEKAVRNRELPQTSGFFFGASDGSEMEEDLTFIRKARKAIAEGLTVYYTSWW